MKYPPAQAVIDDDSQSAKGTAKANGSLFAALDW